MKKLKASEITEPGWYWEFTDDGDSQIVQILNSRKDFIVLTIGDSDSYKLSELELFRSAYIKAEPPKACRWRYAGSASDPLYAVGCREVFVFPEQTQEFKFCPYCGGHIEIEE